MIVKNHDVLGTAVTFYGVAATAATTYSVAATGCDRVRGKQSTKGSLENLTIDCAA